MTQFTIAVNHIIILVIMTVSNPLWTVVSTCEQGEVETPGFIFDMIAAVRQIVKNETGFLNNEKMWVMGVFSSWAAWALLTLHIVIAFKTFLILLLSGFLQCILKPTDPIRSSIRY
jgi:hypothetical protein